MKDFILTTVPKTGTMYVCQILNVLTGKTFPYNNTILFSNKKNNNSLTLFSGLNNFNVTSENEEFKKYLKKLDSNNSFYFWHTPYSENLKIFLNNNNIIPIIIKRDLRNIIISQIKYINKIPIFISDSYFNLPDNFNNLNINKKIDILLSNKRFIKNIHSFVNWFTYENSIILNFENLTNFKMIEYELQKITNGLNIDITTRLIAKVKSLILKKKNKNEQINDDTFSGELSNWKLIYNDNNKQNFKNVFGKLLIDWGYEKNNLW
jgi:hypothetical protein